MDERSVDCVLRNGCGSGAIKIDLGLLCVIDVIAAILMVYHDLTGFVKINRNRGFLSELSVLVCLNVHNN